MGQIGRYTKTMIESVDVDVKDDNYEKWNPCNFPI